MPQVRPRAISAATFEADFQIFGHLTYLKVAPFFPYWMVNDASNQNKYEN